MHVVVDRYTFEAKVGYLKITVADRRGYDRVLEEAGWGI